MKINKIILVCFTAFLLSAFASSSLAEGFSVAEDFNTQFDSTLENAGEDLLLLAEHYEEGLRQCGTQLFAGKLEFLEAVQSRLGRDEETISENEKDRAYLESLMSCECMIGTTHTMLAMHSDVAQDEAIDELKRVVRDAFSVDGDLPGAEYLSYPWLAYTLALSDGHCKTECTGEGEGMVCDGSSYGTFLGKDFLAPAEHE